MGQFARHARQMPGIHDYGSARVRPEIVDGRDKHGHDESASVAN
jgi:hypothetical protein